MARKGSAVTCIVRRVVHGIDMREAGEVDQEGPQHGSADSGHKALALSGGSCCGGSSGGVGTAGADGHGASLWSDSGHKSARKPRERSSQGSTAPAHRGFVIQSDQAGLRACEGLKSLEPANITFPYGTYSGFDVSLAYRCGGSAGLARTINA